MKKFRKFLINLITKFNIWLYKDSYAYMTNKQLADMMLQMGDVLNRAAHMIIDMQKDILHLGLPKDEIEALRKQVTTMQLVMIQIFSGTPEMDKMWKAALNKAFPTQH